MKIIFIVLVLVWCGLAPDSFAQKVIEPNKKWMYAIGQNYPTPQINHYDCLIIEGDTVISNNEYYKLYDLYNCDFEYSYLKGFIRETQDAKIYFLPVNTELEWLLYDFELNVGDSIYSEKDDCYVHLDSVATDNTNRKIYYVSYSNKENLQWIEGVGSNIGLLMERIVGGFQIFTCCFRNEELIYRIPGYSSCNITLSNNVNEMPVPFKLYPNPITTEVEIHFNKPIQVDITGEIISVYGAKLKTFNLGKSSKYILDVRSIKPGVYVIRLNFGTEIYSEKVIVN